MTRVSDDSKTGIIIEVNCETDFVAKSDDFVAFANLALNAVDAAKPANIDALLEVEFDGKKVGEELTSLTEKLVKKLKYQDFLLKHLKMVLL